MGRLLIRKVQVRVRQGAKPAGQRPEALTFVTVLIMLVIPSRRRERSVRVRRKPAWSRPSASLPAPSAMGVTRRRDGSAVRGLAILGSPPVVVMAQERRYPG
jgi:hypothetical protein